MTFLGLKAAADQQVQPVEFGRIVTATSDTATVTLDRLGIDRAFGPYPLVNVALQAAGDPSHTHPPTVPARGTRCLVAFNGGNLADAAVIPFGGA